MPESRQRKTSPKFKKDLFANTIFVLISFIHELFQGTLGVSSPQNSDLLQKFYAQICYDTAFKN
jgi:hypothetical protein